MCWMRQAIDAPWLKASAAMSPPAQCQPWSRNHSIRAAPPRNTKARTVASWAHRLGAPSMSANSRNGGEKIIDCGSAICGWPLNAKGAQAGDWPCARLWARNWICGKNCALASQGIVTRPDSQGQPMRSEAKRKVARANAHGGAMAAHHWLSRWLRCVGRDRVCGGVLDTMKSRLSLGKRAASLQSLTIAPPAWEGQGAHAVPSRRC